MAVGFVPSQMKHLTLKRLVNRVLGDLPDAADANQSSESTGSQPSLPAKEVRNRPEADADIDPKSAKGMASGHPLYGRCAFNLLWGFSVLLVT